MATPQQKILPSVSKLFASAFPCGKRKEGFNMFANYLDVAFNILNLRHEEREFKDSSLSTSCPVFFSVSQE
jgi:hypothetical protein